MPIDGPRHRRVRMTAGTASRDPVRNSSPTGCSGPTGAERHLAPARHHGLGPVPGLSRGRRPDVSSFPAGPDDRRQGIADSAPPGSASADRARCRRCDRRSRAGGEHDRSRRRRADRPERGEAAIRDQRPVRVEASWPMVRNRRYGAAWTGQNPSPPNLAGHGRRSSGRNRPSSLDRRVELATGGQFRHRPAARTGTGSAAAPPNSHPDSTHGFAVPAHVRPAGPDPDRTHLRRAGGHQSADRGSAHRDPVGRCPDHGKGKTTDPAIHAPVDPIWPGGPVRPADPDPAPALLDSSSPSRWPRGADRRRAGSGSQEDEQIGKRHRPASRSDPGKGHRFRLTVGGDPRRVVARAWRAPLFVAVNVSMACINTGPVTMLRSRDQARRTDLETTKEGATEVTPSFVMIVRRRPTLPHSGPCSTIGAERLSFRVRNGAGRFPLAMTAETLWSCREDRFRSWTVSPEPHSGRVAFLW